MDAATARMLTRYNQWSDQVMFDGVAALPEGEALKPRISLFKNMVHTLNHIYVIDRIWQAHLEGRDHGYEARNTRDHRSPNCGGCSRRSMPGTSPGATPRPRRRWLKPLITR
jgi:uncharacterized damage-inducible protein DinB